MSSQLVKTFIQSAYHDGLIHKDDQLYMENRVCFLIGEAGEPSEESFVERGMSRLELLDALISTAVANQVISNTRHEKEQLSARIMDVLTPLPSRVNEVFRQKYTESPKDATDYFFELSQKNDYIKTRAIAQNIEFTHQTEYGELQMTINLSKPEKDPKEIMMQVNTPPSTYPKCLLCVENEGYEGTQTHPARANHRLIRLPIDENTWSFQYSPYAYYNEHAIFVSNKHEPMNVGKQAIRNLLDIVTFLPHYFVGANAGLPIVGGSILSHDHYQGGRHVFPMEQASLWHSFSLAAHPTVQAGLVQWPMSVIRLRGKDKEELVQAADQIMKSWKGYTDASVDVLHETDGTPHNALTPIVRRQGAVYELDLVLRNNRTTVDFPDGLFHPHPDVQHIKKENIGLIEVMGLAILPPRLKREMEQVEEYLLSRSTETEVEACHRVWATTLKEANRDVTEATVKDVIYAAVGEVFLRVLIDAAVFKPTSKGKEAFVRFIESIESP